MARSALFKTVVYDPRLPGWPKPTHLSLIDDESNLLGAARLSKLIDDEFNLLESVRFSDRGVMEHLEGAIPARQSRNALIQINRSTEPAT